MFVFAITVYLTVIIPALKAVVGPAEADPEFTFEQNLGLIGAGNTIIAGLLVLVLVMQARWAIVNNAVNEAECLSCPGWARVCETRRSQSVGCRGERKGQSRKIGLKGGWMLFPYTRVVIYLSAVPVDHHALSLRFGSTASGLVFFETDRHRRAAVCRSRRNDGGNVGFQSERGSDSGISNTRVP